MIVRTCSRLLLAAGLLAAIPAHAYLFRAYVASTGNDANPCSLAQPCRLLPAALAVVYEGGEIWMLDSGNYNTATVNIAKSVTILAVPGALGSIVAVGGPAVNITSGVTDVALRNVVIVALVGAAGATHGVNAANNARVSIEDSVIANLPLGHGVNASTGALVSVHNTTFRGIAGQGIFAQSNARVQVSGSQFIQSTGGIWAQSGGATESTRVTVSDSVFRRLWDSAVRAHSLGGSSFISCTRCAIDTSGYALHASTDNSIASASFILVNASTVTNSTMPWRKEGGTAEILSFGNNQFTPNSSQPIGSLGSVALQ